MHPIYGPGEIACDANLLAMPLSLGREGEGESGVGPAPIKGWPEFSLLRENLRDDDDGDFSSPHCVTALCSSLNLQRVILS